MIPAAGPSPYLGGSPTSLGVPRLAWAAGAFVVWRLARSAPLSRWCGALNAENGKWSRGESNSRPLECHAVQGRTYRPRPCASIQEFAGSTPASQTVTDGRAPVDRPRTAPVPWAESQPQSRAHAADAHARSPTRSYTGPSMNTCKASSPRPPRAPTGWRCPASSSASSARFIRSGQEIRLGDWDGLEPFPS
jgi:hypothetical protein